MTDSISTAGLGTDGAGTATRHLPDGDLLERRREAIDVSGWGEPFRLFQPRNLCMWVFLAGIGAGLVRMVQMFGSSAGYYAEAYSAAIVIGVISTLLWGWWFHHLDRFERQPFALIAACFFWGGIAAPYALAIDGNTALGSLYTKLFGAVWSADWHAGLSAPFIEESSKAAGFILMMGLVPRLIRTPADGLLLGAFLGLGFQTFEDFLYAASSAAGGFGSNQVQGVTGEIAVRMFSDLVSHPLFSALVCAGLVYLIGTIAQPRRVGLGLLLVAAGVVSHMLWDSMVALADGSLVGTWAVMLGDAAFSLGLLWYAFRIANRTGGRFARDILAPETTTGVLTTEEVDALAGHRERRAFLKAAPSRRERRRRKHLLVGALDLCHDLAVGRGADTGDVVQTRADIARVRSA